MKNGVYFNDLHTIDHWDLLLIYREIGTPEPKIIDVDIPGSNSKVDLSECFGQLYYNNRNLLFNFESFKSYNDFQNLIDDILAEIHGKVMKIRLDTDPNFYYYGRCKIDSYSYNKSYGSISISCDVDPFKNKLEITSIENDVVENNVYEFPNLFRPVIPEITVSDNVIFEFENNQYSLNKGTFKNLNIIFKKGTNEIKILSGEGKITFTYQEATL